MRLSITHDTTYRYEDRVRASIQYLRLTPQDSERQHVVDWRLDLPRPARPLRDPYGNILHVLTLDEPHESVLIAAHGLVEIDEEREVEHDRQSPLPFLPWAEAWLGDGWYSFDVTNRLGRPERHLKLAVGLDYLDACPVRGLRRGGGCEQMHARVLVSAPLLQVQQQ